MKHRFYPRIHAGRFYNFEEEQNSVNFIQSAYMFFKFLLKKQRTIFNKQEWISDNKLILPQEKPSIVWIGHATFLIHINGKTILTDPVFDDLSFLFKRINKPGIVFDLLPKIDIVLISHNHWDHLDISCLKKIYKLYKPEILVPMGDKKTLEWHGIKTVKEYMWWERESIAGIEFSFLPAYHWSQRSLFDRNKSLWGSWMISHNSFTIYFAGDTAYSQHFSAIAKEFSSIDIALMPIGPCEPKKWMRLSHATAEEAVQGFMDLKAKHFVPMHWGTFHFGLDEIILPIERLVKEWQMQELSQKENFLHLLKLGEQKIFF
jgi:L-ascorbate metabolism protein UlaG (beta-lactamase superfamily)